MWKTRQPSPEDSANGSATLPVLTRIFCFNVDLLKAKPSPLFIRARLLGESSPYRTSNIRIIRFEISQALS